jgi:hypothetical protein
MNNPVYTYISWLPSEAPRGGLASQTRTCIDTLTFCFGSEPKMEVFRTFRWALLLNKFWFIAGRLLGSLSGFGFSLLQFWSEHRTSVCVFS